MCFACMCHSPIGDIHPVTLTGPLTAWDQECRLLFRYYGNLEDSFSLRILDVASCATSSIAMRCSSRQGRSRPVSLSPPCFMPYVQPQPTNVFTPAQAAFWDHCAGETIAWKSLLRRWHFMDDDVHLKRAMCVWVPEPIAALIRRGEWSFLVIARRWLGFDQDSWLWKQVWVPRPTEQWLQMVQNAGTMCMFHDVCLHFGQSVDLQRNEHVVVVVNKRNAANVSFEKNPTLKQSYAFA